MPGFLDQPHSHPLRRALFQVHLWLGLVLGLYLTVVCVTGSVLVFRSDLQRVAFPELLAADPDIEPVGLANALDALQARYPAHRITGVEAPTRYRQTFLAYVVDGERFRTVLSDPATGRVLGELPEDSWVAQLQSLHFNFLLGKTGHVLHQIVAIALAGLVISGGVIWWQGRRRWRRGLKVRGGPWPGVLRNLHSALGAWTGLALLMISITALSLLFPKQFRSILTISSSPSVAAVQATAPGATRTPRDVIALAHAMYPREYISRVVLPSERDAIYQVNFTPSRPTSLAPGSQKTRYFNLGGSEVTGFRPPTGASRIINWITALHVGNFAGNGIRIAWMLLGLLPPALFATGFLLWWRRILRPRSSPASTEAAPN